jgi:hypothetical protein
MTFRTSFTIKGKEVQAPARDLSSRTALVLAVLACLVSLWIRAGIPLVAVPVGFHDDAFFARTAHHLLAGQWLGPYDKMTLSKGMLYPLFVAVVSVLSVPLKIAEQLVYLAASGIMALAAMRAFGRRWFGLLTFVALAFNPVLWHNWLARVSREGLYVALSLGLFAAVVVISFPQLRRSQRHVPLGFAFGLVWASFWLTREESVWILPACLIVIGLGVINTWLRASRRVDSPAVDGKRLQSFRPIVVPFVVGFVVFTLGVGLVAALNWHYYGVFRTNEFRSGGFVKAYGAFSRIQGNTFQRYVPVPVDARQKAYEVSPKARELSGSLDGERGHAWATMGCSKHPIQPPCDLQGGWFSWALRDAAEQSGHYQTATNAEHFYAEVAEQINHACDSGQIRCLPRRETFTPSFRWEYVGETLESAKGMTGIVLGLGEGDVSTVPSPGSKQGLAAFADLTNEYLSPPAEGIVQDFLLGRADGWVAGREKTPTLEVLTYTKREVKSSITTWNAPDVLAVLPNLKSVRFTLLSDCPVLECDLVIHSSAGQVLIPFSKLVRGTPLNTPDLTLFIDLSTADEETSHIGAHRRAIQQKLGHEIGLAYTKTSRVLALLAALGLAVGIVRFRPNRGSLAMIAIALGSLVAAASRVMVLAYIDATTFIAGFVHYLSPASPFLIVFIVSGVYVGYSSFAAPIAKP